MDFEFLKTIRQKRNRFATKLGISVDEVRLGYSRVSKTICEDDLNPLDLTHGGVYFTMADNAAGTAMATHGYMAVTANASYNFFRSAGVGELVTAEAREIKYGNTISVYEVQVRNLSGTLLGNGTFTFCKLDKKLEE